MENDIGANEITVELFATNEGVASVTQPLSRARTRMPVAERQIVAHAKRRLDSALRTLQGAVA